jgi:hypothetical protein
MLELKFDFSDVDRFARELEVAQREIRYAASRTINDACFAAKDQLAGVTWPTHVQVRAPSFARATLHVTKSTPDNLVAELNETKSDILGAHDRGDTITAKGRSLVVPVTAYRASRMTQHGLRSDAKLGAVLRRASAKRSVRIVGDKVYVASRGLGLKLAFLLRKSIQQRADAPLTQDFNETVTRYVTNNLINNLVRALRTSRYLR